MAKSKKPLPGHVQNFCIHFPHIDAVNTANHYGITVNELQDMLGEDKFNRYFPGEAPKVEAPAEEPVVETAAAAEPKKRKRKIKSNK